MYFYKLYFRSSAYINHIEQIEKIFFFNKSQKKYYEKIEENVNLFGSLKIRIKQDKVYIEPEKTENFYNLFCYDKENENSNLLGVMIYELKTDKCNIIHVAVDENCQHKGEYSNQLIFLRMIEKIKNDLKHTNVKEINLPYTNKKFKIGLKILQTNLIY